MTSLTMDVSESTSYPLNRGIFTYQGFLLDEPKEIRTTVISGNFLFPLSHHHLVDEIIIPGCDCLTIFMKPVPKPRETKKDVWQKRPSVMRFRFFRDVVRGAMEHFNFVPSHELGLKFYMQMPKLSKIKTAERNHKPHELRPDLDNLEKATVDALYVEDSVVHTKLASKKWSLEPRIEIWNLK